MATCSLPHDSNLIHMPSKQACIVFRRCRVLSAASIAQTCGLHARSYNLPETIRESDIEKLSFAVQLAEGFYADTQACAFFDLQRQRVTLPMPIFLPPSDSASVSWLEQCSLWQAALAGSMNDLLAMHTFMCLACS